MRPWPCSRITGNAACISHTVPFTPRSNGTSRSASVRSSTGTGGFDVTALATTPSTVPNSLTAASTNAKFAARSPASAVRATYDAPRSSSSADSVASPSAPRADTTSSCPRPARYRAIPRPTPWRRAGDDDDLAVEIVRTPLTDHPQSIRRRS